MAEPVHTIADFLAVVRRSGLVAEDRLAETVATWADTSLELPAELPQALVAAELLTQWQSDQLRKGKHKGFMLGKYKLLGLLGVGGMSSVYLAENTTLGELVAIKVLPLKRVDQTSFLARFTEEARRANKLSHQNLARSFDRDSAGGVNFIVMEYIDGTDLHVLVKEHIQRHDRSLDVRDAVDYIRQAAEGLHVAHEEGVVHRDVKPANLMLNRKGIIKVLDLGLALKEDDDQQASVTREHDEKVLGTADYLAPEQARDSHTADRRSDIYALGCTLHYLLIGKPPFAQGKLAERIQAHLNKQAPNILDERPDVPPAIADLYYRMMEKVPAARPQTAQEVADILRGWLNSTKQTDPKTSPPQFSRRGSPRPPGGGSAIARPVVRSGPGSGGSSSISLGPASLPRPTGGKRPGAKKLAAVRPQKGSDRAEEPDDAKGRVKRRRSWEFAGYPLGFWIVLIGGLIAVSVLGVLLFLRSR